RRRSWYPMRKHRIGLHRLAPVAAMIVACGVAGTVAFARSAAAPQNTAVPQISGTAKEGSTLTASNGTWSNTPTSFGYQWQRCSSTGADCINVGGATSPTYGVRSADVGHRMRALVTARTSAGRSTVVSSPSSVVLDNTTTTTTTVQGNKAPTITFISL